MAYKSFTYNKTYSISIVDDVSIIESDLQSFVDFNDYRNIFNSKEWILAYCKIYSPKEIVFVKSFKTLLYAVLEITDNEIHMLGDPFNDYNLLVIPPEDFKEIIYLLKSETNKCIRINCLVSPLSIQLQNCRKDVGLKWHEQEKGIYISSKLQRIYNRDQPQIQFFRVTPADEIFQPILSKLLLGRITILQSKNNEGNDASINENFSKFITKLCLNKTIENNIFLDYCVCNENIVSIGLNFRHNNNVLYYLRWCLHSSNQHSYGLLHDIISMQRSRDMGYGIVDFARGNEAYKYRFRLTEYNLYNYEL